MSAMVEIAPGARLWFDGQVVEVVDFDGRSVTLRGERTGAFTAVSLARLAAQARALDVEPAPERPGAGALLAALTTHQRQEVERRTTHVRELLCDDRAERSEAAQADGQEPAKRSSWSERVAEKAAELGVSPRTVRRWVAAFEAHGPAGLVDARVLKDRGRRVDGRWEEALAEVLAEDVNSSTPTRSAVLGRVRARLAERHGVGVVPLPSRATAYRRLGELTKGTNAVSGSARHRRSIADRPVGVYGRLRAVRPGEYTVLDTQDLDVYAMEPVTCRWVRAQLTVAQDLFTRAIVGLRVSPVSTKAVDVAGVLFEALAPAEEENPALGPGNRGFGSLLGEGVCPPETLVVDNGRAFLSAHVVSVCTRIGISIQPAQPCKPTDKPTVERFFKTLREGLIQHLPAYLGPDVHSRGLNLEDQAFFFLHELEEVIREWISQVYHRSKHEGLVVAQWPHLPLSPLEMLQVGIARAGRLRLPADPHLVYDFLQVAPRTIQHYGVEVNGLRYDGPVLTGYRNTPSPYGGTLAGRWPIRVNPDDVRFVYFHDPADASWHRLTWEHAPMLTTPFSGEAAAYARRLALRDGRGVEASQALVELLARWGQGMVMGRRERRMAARLAAQRSALVLPAWPEPDPPLPSAGAAEPPGERVPLGDVDDEEEITDVPAGEDYYADAFEVME